MPTEGLTQGRFDTRGMAEEESRQAYLDRLDGILDTEFLEPFAADMRAYGLGPLNALYLVASRRRSIRTAERIAVDRYDSIGIQYIVAGTASGDADGRPVASDPGTVMILDYGRPFSILDLERRTVINIAVPRELYIRHAPITADLHGTVVTGEASTMLAGYMDGLGRVLGELRAIAGAPLASAFLHLLSATLNGEDRSDDVANRNARTIRRAERLVADRIGSGELDPAWLANKLGLSRSELYAVMEPFGGVARFIMQQRLQGVRRVLEEPSDTRRIGAIAYAYGFSSEAHFARAFRASFGTTASEVRRATRAQHEEPIG